MFTFHKPKVYRSTAGCCICKAKSSSSRFTDSKKYENDFPMCFQLSTPRQGEICNACVLLVKRFKRLPAGSTRHWGHVVDARAGPGIKCMSKVKKRCEESLKNMKVDECDGVSGDEDECWSDDEPADDPPSDDDEVVICKKKKITRKDPMPRKDPLPRKNIVKPIHNSTFFINRRVWKQLTTCCADIWKNLHSQCAVELSSLHTCPNRVNVTRLNETTKVPECGDTAIPGKVFNDNSSDSGYDESGNISPQ